VWSFRLLAILLSLSPLVLLEGGLRWCGVGYDTRLVVPAPNAERSNLYRFNPAADRSYYGVEDLCGPDPRPFELPKPPGTFRAVVVGGSSVAGFPYPFELALPHQLELVLQQQLPERKIEVLNAGMTAIMSTSEVDILQQSLDTQPDLIIVHSGHNEFYGPGGSASNFGAAVSLLHPLAKYAKRLRSVQLLLSILPKPREKHLVSILPADIHIPLNGPVFDRAVHRFQANLNQMVDLANRAHVPVMLSTVPANLRDLAPLQPTESPKTERQLREFARLSSYREYEAALDVLNKANQEDPNDPVVVYRQGQCLEVLGRQEEAARRYILAADLDGCRFRAPSKFLAVTRRVAEESPGSVFFCDVAGILQARSRDSVPGSDYFLEHVHYNLEGTWAVATILAEAIVSDVLGANWEPDRHPDPISRDRLLSVSPLDLLAAESLTLIVYQAWPFSLSLDRQDEARRAQARIVAGFRALEPSEAEVFASLNMDAMQQSLWLAMGDAWLTRGQPDRAVAAYQRHIDRRPWDPAGYAGAGNALRAAGKHAEAEHMRRRAVSHSP
jgi:tetratricopeptide (TPR) repeat protein